MSTTAQALVVKNCEPNAIWTVFTVNVPLTQAVLCSRQVKCRCYSATSLPGSLSDEIQKTGPRIGTTLVEKKGSLHANTETFPKPNPVVSKLNPRLLKGGLSRCAMKAEWPGGCQGRLNMSGQQSEMVAAALMIDKLG